MSEKPVMMILPRWDPDEPRFIVTECEKCSDDRAFKNNKCVYNQRLGFAYSVDEIVEVLNNTDELNELKKENEQLKKALLFYIDVALCETSSNFNKDFDNICNNLFGCSYNEIKHLYSDIGDEDDVFALFQR